MQGRVLLKHRTRQCIRSRLRRAGPGSLGVAYLLLAEPLRRDRTSTASDAWARRAAGSQSWAQVGPKLGPFLSSPAGQPGPDPPADPTISPRKLAKCLWAQQGSNLRPTD